MAYTSARCQPPSHVARLRLLCAAVLLMGAAWSGSSRASDPHAALAAKPAAADAHGEAAKPAAKPAAKDAHAAPAPKPDAHAKPAHKGAADAPDPMDTLREKLAAKLGATKAPESKSPYVVRVVSKPDAGHGTNRPAARSAEHTAKLVASLRAEKAADLHGAAAGEHAKHWAYSGDGGPETWGSLKPEFAKCSTGQRQSPIDIRGGVTVNLDPVQFDYRGTGFNVVDNGHTVQVNIGSGNAIEVMGRRYELVQFHFHRPSEERINGRQFDMVVHMVHKDPEGKLAVVAVLLDRGSAQPVIQTVWNALPLEKGEAVPAPTQIDVAQLLPEDRRYYTYMGSLTTPPCSEGVLWMVMKQPVALSPSQIGIFARLYPMNARPIQKVSGRMIKESH